MVSSDAVLSGRSQGFCLILPCVGLEGGYLNMKTFDSIIKKAWDVYMNRDNYCYLMGAKGQKIVSRSQFDQIVSWSPEHFSRYNKTQLDEIYNYCLGKTAFDCSGFIYYLTGDYNYSAIQWSHCTQNKSLADGVAGSILYKTGHIGIDLGYGLFMHFPIEMHTAEIGWIRNYSWTHSGLHKDIDYTGSTNK